MRLCLFLSVLILISCGVKQQSVLYGETSKESLILLKGEPLQEVKAPAPDSTVLIYSDSESYQVRNGVVQASLKAPASENNSVIFWKHKLKDCMTVLKRIESTNPHVPTQIELECAEQGIKIVYLEGSATILKVVEYAKE